MQSELLIESFDIFDTLLTRPWGSPESAFLVLGQKLAIAGMIECSPAAFALRRAEAEANCFANAGGLDSYVSLLDIYRELAWSMPLDVSRMAQFEFRFESETLVVIKAGAERLAAARRAGRRIAFVSDMYLSPSEIRLLLSVNGLYRPGDRLLVSSNSAKSKRSGRLFGELLRIEDLPGNRICHHGNDAVSDIKSARRAGLHLNSFAQGNLNRYEKALDSDRIATDSLSSSIAGASRLARLALAQQGPHQRAIATIATSVAAPLIIGFVVWVLRSAMRRDLKRLYFIARDGQLLLAVARQLAPKIGCSVELRYLYGSRLAWGELSSQSATSKSDLPDTSCPVRSDLRQAYFKQEGLLDDTDQYGIVDLGTGATLFDALGDELNRFGLADPVAFYLGQRASKNSRQQTRIPERYLFDVNERRGYYECDRIVTFLEMICTANHGSVLGYRQSGANVEPVLASGTTTPLEQWGQVLCSQAVVATAQHLATEPSSNAWQADIRQCALRAYRLFWEQPTRDEALAWGQFPFDDGQGANTNWVRIASPYSMGALVRRQGRHRHWWHRGALAQSHVGVKTLFALRSITFRVGRKVWRRFGRHANGGVSPATGVANAAESAASAGARGLGRFSSIGRRARRPTRGTFSDPSEVAALGKQASVPAARPPSRGRSLDGREPAARKRIRHSH